VSDRLFAHVMIFRT